MSSYRYKPTLEDRNQLLEQLMKHGVLFIADEEYREGTPASQIIDDASGDDLVVRRNGFVSLTRRGHELVYRIGMLDKAKRHSFDTGYLKPKSKKSA